LTLHLDPEQARETAGWVFPGIGVPETDALAELVEHFDGMGVARPQILRTPTQVGPCLA
jgi:hypothetical protein